MIALLSHRKLKTHIAEKNFKQEPFAELVGISDRHVRNLCSRDTDVAVSLLYNMSSVLEVAMPDLLILHNIRK